jgi:hypothetical protein
MEQKTIAEILDGIPAVVAVDTSTADTSTADGIIAVLKAMPKAERDAILDRFIQLMRSKPHGESD